MSFHGSIPHVFLVLIIIAVVFFVLKSLIKFAIIVGAIGLVIYLVWSLNLIGRIRGGFIPAFA